MSIWFTLRREKLRKIIRMVTALRQVSIITHCSLSQTPRPVKYEIYGTAFMYNLHQRVVCNRHLVKKPVNVKTLKIGIGYFISSFFNYLRHTCNRNRSSGQGLWQEQIFIFYPVFTEENLCGQRRYKFQDPVQIQKIRGRQIPLHQRWKIRRFFLL